MYTPGTIEIYPVVVGQRKKSIAKVSLTLTKYGWNTNNKSSNGYFPSRNTKMPGSLVTPSAVIRPNRNKKPNKGFVAPRFDSANAKSVAEEAFATHSGGGNDIHVDAIAKLMKSLGFFQEKRNTGRDLVVALGQMGPPSSSITKTQFVSWYVNNVSDFGGSALNRLLVKDQLGKGRTSSYQLPGNNFTYGHMNKWDAEGAGEVALTWVKGKLSTTERGRRNIVAENKAAAGAGAPTGKALANYRAANPKYVKAKVVGKKSRRTNPYSKNNLCYGRASVASESVGKVMETGKMALASFDMNYPDMSGQEMPGKMPPPRPTKSSNLLYHNARLPSNNMSGTGGAFKMKKFLKVEGKVQSFNRK